MDLNKLLTMPISTLMQHRINMSNIFNHKVYDLENWSDKINFFQASLEFEYDLFRGAESQGTISYYSPIISYPGQTVSSIFTVDKNGKRSLVDLMDIKKSSNLKLYINQESPEEHDQSYNDSDLYYENVKSQWSGVLISLSGIKRVSKTKSELTNYYNISTELSKIMGYDLNLTDGTYSDSLMVKSAHNQNLTFVSLLWAYFNLHKNVNWDEIIKLFEHFKKHLTDVEAYFKGDRIDLEYYFGHIAKIIIDSAEGT